jgi:hypothetical protein
MATATIARAGPRRAFHEDIRELRFLPALGTRNGGEVLSGNY